MELPLLIAHVVSAMMWTGGVFMAAIVDWPVLKHLASDGRFPFEVIVGQGAGVFRWVYAAIVTMLLTSVGLASLHWPADTMGLVMLLVKGLALAFMVGSTVYGTLGTWRKLQFATHEAAFRLYGAYIVRARLIFACGVVAHVVGILFSRRFAWFGA